MVEDDQSSRRYLRLILQRQDYEIVEATNAEEALNIVDDKRIDGMLLDIALGQGLNGLELGENLKNRKKFEKTPMIAVTAYPRENLGDMDSKGFTGYLQKPYVPDELWDILRQNFPNGKQS